LRLRAATDKDGVLFFFRVQTLIPDGRAERDSLDLHDVFYW